MHSSTDVAARPVSGNTDPFLVPPETMTTNAVSRNLSDLHTPTWLALLAINITGRTLVFHPLQLAISRKRVTRAERPPTAGALMRAAFQGGKHSFSPGKVGPVEAFDFGRGGVRGCYRGVGAALISNLVGEVSYLFTLETLKEYLGGGGANRGRNPTAADTTAADAPTAVLVTSLESTSEVASKTAGAAEAPAVRSEDFVAHSTSAAAGAMVGDLVALLLVTPTVVLCNRQMTAGYGMAADNVYRSLPQTFREVWGAYQDPAAAAARAKAAFMSTEKAFSLAWWRNGFLGIYQGTSAGLLRIPSSGCWWALYTKAKEAVYRVAAPTLTHLEERRLHELAEAPEAASSIWRKNWFLSPTDNPLLNAVAGIFASVCTTVLFNPMAVVQTRQQSLPPEFWAAQKMKHAHKHSATELAARSAALSYRVKKVLPFQKVYTVAADLVRTEGPMAFFKGALANVGVAVMDGVIFSLLFEMSKLGSDTQFLEQLGAHPDKPTAGSAKA